MRHWLPLALLCIFTSAQAQNVLNNSDHVVTTITGELTSLGNSTSIVNQTCPTGTTPGVSCFSSGGPQFVLPPSAFIANAISTSVAEYVANSATSTGTPNANAPYKVLNQSSGGYSLTGYEQPNYATLVSNDVMYVMPYCEAGGTDLFPPVMMASVGGQNAASPITLTTCGYGPGLEFTQLTSDGGCCSSGSASFAAKMATLRVNHPTWTWPDIKGALRQTASNWATGWVQNNAGAQGFGNISYSSANAISSASSIYLQAPNLTFQNFGYYAVGTLYPYRQTRRVKEVVYIGGTWPNPATGCSGGTCNEYTAAQMAAAGGTLIYTSNGTDTTPQFTYAPAVSGSATFHAFTLDSSGNGSRVESYNAQSQSFTVGTMCLQ